MTQRIIHVYRVAVAIDVWKMMMIFTIQTQLRVMQRAKIWKDFYKRLFLFNCCCCHTCARDNFILQDEMTCKSNLEDDTILHTHTFYIDQLCVRQQQLIISIIHICIFINRTFGIPFKKEGYTFIPRISVTEDYFEMIDETSSESFLMILCLINVKFD